jgi:hypothetical protein
MNKRLLLSCFAVAVLLFPGQAWAQFTDAHSYDNAPVGTNQIELSYAHLHANSSIDTSLIITGAKLNVNQGTITYSRYFGLFDRTTWVEAGLPIGSLSGSVSGTGIQGSIVGAGDSSFQVGMLLKGAPALTAERFHENEPATTLGVSFSFTAPTGQYDANKVLNLGSDRWVFKPEFAFSQPFGPEQKWQVDAYANAYFYTDNNTFHGNEILHQQPQPGFEGHLSYSFSNSVWLSLDTRYSFRANTFVDGVDQNNGQQNFIVGSEMNVSISARHSLLFEFAKALVHENGPMITGFAVKYNYTWGKGYR